MFVAPTSAKPLVAIEGASYTARYLIEQLEKDGRYEIILISRAERPGFNRPSLRLHISDYTETSILSILKATNATILFSFIHSNDHFFIDVHLAMLAACSASCTCKRLVPSEYGGDLMHHADKPRMYIPTHGRMRRALRAHTARGGPVERTLVNHGWFMDYFVPLEQRYYKPVGPAWPLNTESWTARIPGTGEERIGWTAGRDVARALVRLIEVPRGEWPKEVYVSGEEATWHEAMRWVEDFHGQKFKLVMYTSPASVYRDIVDYHDDPENVGKLLLAYIDEWNFSDASATPKNIVEAQRRKFFPDIYFHSVKEIMEIGKKEGHI